MYENIKYWILNKILWHKKYTLYNKYKPIPILQYVTINIPILSILKNNSFKNNKIVYLILHSGV